MESVSLNIKNMVCPRCILAVENAMRELGVTVKNITLGHAVVSIPEEINKSEIKEKLNQLGFELIEDRESACVEKIKVLVIEYVELLEKSDRIQILSDYLTEKLGKNYNYLTRLFTRQCDMTIQEFFIRQRLQRVKELLDEDELNVTEISYRLSYSSVNYLSSQFKKYIGMSISQYKELLHQTKEIYKRISESINELNRQGIFLNFIKKDNKYYCEELNEYFTDEEVSIEEKYKYRYGVDDIHSATVSLIRTGKLQGILVEADEKMDYSRLLH